MMYGCTLGILGPSLGSWGRLGASWARLGVGLGASWDFLRSRLDASWGVIDFESHQPSGRPWFRGPLSHISHIPTSPKPLGERFTSPLPLSVDPSPRNLDVGGPPVAPQSNPGTIQQSTFFVDRFLKPFWFHFGSQNDPQNLPKSSKNLSKNNFVQKNANF